jgi:hypothetical protein
MCEIDDNMYVIKMISFKRFEDDDAPRPWTWCCWQSLMKISMWRQFRLIIFTNFMREVKKIDETLFWIF